MDKLIGKKLDGVYEIRSLIGSGGMANVYKAVDLRTNTDVAVKVLREEYMGDPDLVRRFKNESKAISILNHPNIVKVYDVSVTDKLQYIVMEFIDGITLKEYLTQRGGRITWRETVHFITQVLLALQHAHENGVVHRDVKPQNIMLLPNGGLKMMDFGIARISRAENQLVSGKAMGSVHYISPEQARGDVTDAKSDIYSVGVMMYEMLSGQLPFHVRQRGGGRDPADLGQAPPAGRAGVRRAARADPDHGARNGQGARPPLSDRGGDARGSAPLQAGSRHPL
jgi:serine/threonine protein kinase